MAFCVQCGQQLAEGVRFCANCGTPVGKEGRTQRETVYEGNLHKCPNCGEILKSFTTNCPACGHEIRSGRTTNSVRELSQKLERLEAMRPPKKPKSMFAQAFSGGQLQHIDEQKVDLIKNYTIPNTKEDILEFIILAASNIDLKVYGLNSQQYQVYKPAQRELSDAWLSKLEQADQKAEILFGGTSEYSRVRSVYEKKLKEIKRKKLEMPLLIIGILAATFIPLILCGIFLA